LIALNFNSAIISYSFNNKIVYDPFLYHKFHLDDFGVKFGFELEFGLEFGLEFVLEVGPEVISATGLAA
jgi:hypothetical protein